MSLLDLTCKALIGLLLFQPQNIINASLSVGYSVSKMSSDPLRHTSKPRGFTQALLLLHFFLNMLWVLV